jgi:hypothetical protein
MSVSELYIQILAESKKKFITKQIAKGEDPKAVMDDYPVLIQTVNSSGVRCLSVQYVSKKLENDIINQRYEIMRMAGDIPVVRKKIICVL